MQGWGRGRPGARLPSLVAGRRPSWPAERGERGPVPGWDEAVESIPTFSYGLYRGVQGPRNYSCGSGWGVRTPSILGHATSSRGHPLPAWGLLAQGWGGVSGGCSPPPGREQLGEEAGALAGREGGKGGVWRGEPEGSKPHHLYKLVLQAP